MVLQARAHPIFSLFHLLELCHHCSKPGAATSGENKKWLGVASHRSGAGSPMGREKPEMGPDDLDYRSALERSAHQLAALTRAIHDLERHGPAVMHEGSTILDTCEQQIKRLSSLAAPGHTGEEIQDGQTHGLASPPPLS
jgi:hypothetical protein